MIIKYRKQDCPALATSTVQLEGTKCLGLWTASSGAYAEFPIDSAASIAMRAAMDPRGRRDVLHAEQCARRSDLCRYDPIGYPLQLDDFELSEVLPLDEVVLLADCAAQLPMVKLRLALRRPLGCRESGPGSDR